MRGARIFRPFEVQGLSLENEVMKQNQRLSWHEYGEGETSFTNEFINIHSLLYKPCQLPEMEPFIVAHLQDRLNIRRYFERAISHMGLDKASRQ